MVLGCANMCNREYFLYFCVYLLKQGFMNRRIHVVWGVSIFAILCLLIFQGFWLNRMIEFKKIEYLNLINNILSGAIESGFEEYVVGNRTISKNPVRVSIHSSDNTVKFVWKGDTTIVD